MRKSLLALAVLGAFAGVAHAQSSVTIYGIIDASLSYNSKVATTGTGNGNRMGVDSGAIKGSRIGFKGSEDLGGGLKALFNLENGFNLDTGAAAQNGNLWGRTATVGLSGNFGAVLLGRQKDFTDDIAAFTSVNDFGGMVSQVHARDLDRTNGERVNNSIRYNTPNINGFYGSAIYGFGEQAGANTAGQSFGLGGAYSNGPFNVGLSYFQAKKAGTVASSDVNSSNATTCGNAAGSAGDTCLKTWTLATSYQFGPAKVYGSWSRVKLPLATAGSAASFSAASAASYAGDTTGQFLVGGVNNEKNDIFDVGVNYSLTPALSLLGSVQYTRANFVNASNGRLIQLNLGGKYALSKRTSLYAIYRNLRASDTYSPGVTSSQAPGADSSQNAFNAGIIHTF
ncbi:MAG: Outer membrane porin protein 32 [Herbaspirillum frisingense]|uniref:Outer membrane porin protein 32 n=1 Tax=Herbaspirillum frisingense TaxID=92645 RepID=A0A7V8FT15_9BURK|nr:MAG: Outer membrane porin protein 32 [Herbaspirillum frisingense]